MDKSALIQKTVETLSPFETDNLINFAKTVTMKSAMGNPWIVGGFLLVAFYAVIVRSKAVLSILFTAISLMLLIRFTMPPDGDTLSLSSTIPFAFGGLAIGAVLIYLNFIKTE